LTHAAGRGRAFDDGRGRAFDVVVVGGGHNGLVAAAYAARAGLRTLVLERRDRVGGAAVTEEVWPGWRVSTASYVCSLLDPAVIADLDLAAHGYAAYLKDAASFTPALDGRSLLLVRDQSLNAREIARFAPRDVAGFEAFGELNERLGAAVFERLDAPEPRWDSFDAATRALLEGSVADIVERYVETPILQAALGADGTVGTYRGVRDPGTGYVLAHHAAGRALGVQGAWGYVRGGMGAISNAIASAARAAGAEIETGAAVARIVVERERATGVVLADGREFAARAVLSNAGPRTTFLHLTGASHFAPAFVRKIERWESIGPSLKLNLALGELPHFTGRSPDVGAAHYRGTIRIAPDLDYLQRAYDEARRDGQSREPYLECFLQTPTDDSLAPAGKHLLSIFAQYFPYERSDGPWDAAKRERAADGIIALLARYAPNLPAAIEGRQLLAPPDLEARFGLEGGHIFHGELLPHQIFERRFATRTPLAGLYLCGSAAHPGGCVSGVPGRRAAAALLADLPARVP
jgi:phytoene dehydrogenase-like protein